MLGVLWACGSQIGVKNASEIKNTSIKLILCTQGFREVGSSMKLIIFDETENFL